MLARLLCVLLVASAIAGGGCATYANYPEVGDDWAVNDPNVSPLPTLIELSLARVIGERPPSGEYLINPPEGTRRAVAARIAAGLGEGARIVEAGTLDLPTYHVTRVWVRNARAEVDVVRPASPRSQTGGVTQTVTVRLERGLGGWRISSTRAWSLRGTTPDLFGWAQEVEPADEPGSE